MRLLLKDCALLKGEEEVIRHILIKGGKIEGIYREKPFAERQIDACQNIVIPGMIDPHVHFRDPGLSHKETFFTGSCAAAAGGITSVIDMPNTEPPAISSALLDEKRRVASKSIVDYGFHFGAAMGNSSEIRSASNTASTKLFMNLSTGRMMVEGPAMIEDIFRASRIVSVHAEAEKVAEAVAFSKSAKKRLYLCHLSLREEVDFIRKAKDERIFCEATPHHLFLTDKDAKKLRGFGMMKPSLKSRDDQRALWEALNDGIIDTVGTDHAPHTIDEKKSKSPPSGVTGCETALPLLLDAVNSGKLSLRRVVELTSRNPAGVFGIENKGIIAPGYDADLTVVDMNMKKKVENRNLFTKCGWSPFDGKILKGWPVMTIVRGNVVFDGSGIYEIPGREIVFNQRGW